MLGFCHCGATRGASFPDDLAICRPSVPANAMFKTVYSNFKSNYVVIKKVSESLSQQLRMNLVVFMFCREMFANVVCIVKKTRTLGM